MVVVEHITLYRSTTIWVGYAWTLKKPIRASIINVRGTGALQVHNIALQIDIALQVHTVLQVHILLRVVHSLLQVHILFRHANRAEGANGWRQQPLYGGNVLV